MRRIPHGAGASLGPRFHLRGGSESRLRQGFGRRPKRLYAPVGAPGCAGTRYAPVHRARANVAHTTPAAPAERSTRAHSEKVEPVVTTSSMRSTRFPSTSSGSTMV